MPVWFNVRDRAPAEKNEWVTQYSFFRRNPADADRAPAGVIYYKTSPAGIPPDLHPGHPTPEIIYVFKGEGVLEEGDKRSVIKEGDAIYVHAGVPHLIWTTTDDPGLWLVAFRTPRDFFGDFVEPGPPDT